MSNARHYDILAAAVTRVQTLISAGITLGGVAYQLTNIETRNVQAMLLPLVDHALKVNSLNLPAIILSPGTTGETINAGGLNQTNLSDVYGYPVTIAIVENATAPALFDNLNRYLYWREALMKVFHGYGIPSVSVVRCDVDPKATVEQGTWVDSKLFVSGFVVRFYSSEHVRG